MSKKQTLFGLHTLKTLIETAPERLIRLYMLNGREDKAIQALLKQVQALGIPVQFVSRQELDHLTGGQNHQGVAALCDPVSVYTEKDIPELLSSSKNPLVLVLDGVQDPHNLGACFRTADAAGVNFIIAPKDKSVGLTPIVSKVASGAVESVPFVQVTNLVRAIDILKEAGVWVYGAAGEAGNNLYQADFSGAVALVMGAEGEGLRRLTREHCDSLLNIPMQGVVGSLNVSVATGVFLFEVVRQRHLGSLGLKND